MSEARRSTEAGAGPAVVRAAESLGRLRARIAKQHAEQGLGYATCGLATDLFDAIVIDVWQAVLAGCDPAEAERLARHVALVAHGGFGRREMAPYSDIDLMLLSDGGIDAGLVATAARRLVQDLFDAGLTVGQSVRSVAEAAQLASGDATIFSTLLDCRTLFGRATSWPGFAAGSGASSGGAAAGWPPCFRRHGPTSGASLAKRSFFSSPT